MDRRSDDEQQWWASVSLGRDTRTPRQAHVLIGEPTAECSWVTALCGEQRRSWHQVESLTVSVPRCSQCVELLSVRSLGVRKFPGSPVIQLHGPIPATTVTRRRAAIWLAARFCVTRELPSADLAELLDCLGLNPVDTRDTQPSTEQKERRGQRN